jgi:hypothetical protein
MSKSPLDLPNAIFNKTWVGFIILIVRVNQAIQTTSLPTPNSSHIPYPDYQINKIYSSGYHGYIGLIDWRSS